MLIERRILFLSDLLPHRNGEYLVQLTERVPCEKKEICTQHPEAINIIVSEMERQSAQSILSPPVGVKYTAKEACVSLVRDGAGNCFSHSG